MNPFPLTERILTISHLSQEISGYQMSYAQIILVLRDIIVFFPISAQNERKQGGITFVNL